MKESRMQIHRNETRRFKKKKKKKKEDGNENREKHKK